MSDWIKDRIAQRERETAFLQALIPKMFDLVASQPPQTLLELLETRKSNVEPIRKSKKAP